jgi:26S proteasome regulatory subunit N2
VDTFVAISSLPQASQQANQSFNPAFPQPTNGATSTSAGLTSPTTPFSQSTLPSKSLLSRPESSSVEPGQARAETAGVTGASDLPLVLQRGVQGQLKTVIERLFERCFQQKQYRQVIGIAVEAKNLEIVRNTILRATRDEKQPQGEDLLEYLLGICMNVVQERALRNEVRLNSPVPSNIAVHVLTIMPRVDPDPHS